jgi:fatty acid desaturase
MIQNTLKNAADVKTLWFMAFTTALLIVQWNMPAWNWYVSPMLMFVACTMAITVAVTAHNHNHAPMWKSPTMNLLTDYWITLFYGFPVFAWIPTHNRNHHHYNNREGDHTITYRFSEKNNFFNLATYPLVSGYFQQKAIFEYLGDLRSRNPRRFWESALQYVALVVYIGAALIWDWQKAVLYILIPHQVGLTSVLIFNYVQHVHADEESEWNHSRNFVSPFLNWLLFNNGFHTVHHERAHTHWSKNREEHAKVAHLIDPVLNQPSFWGYIIKAYFLAPFSKQFATESMRLRRIEAQRTTTVAPAHHAPSLHMPEMASPQA